MKTSSLVNISPSRLYSSKHLSPCRKRRRCKKRLSLRPNNLLKKPRSPSPSKLRASRLPRIMKAISIGDVAAAVPEVAVVVARALQGMARTKMVSRLPLKVVRDAVDVVEVADSAVEGAEAASMAKKASEAVEEAPEDVAATGDIAVVPRMERPKRLKPVLPLLLRLPRPITELSEAARRCR